MAEQIGKLSFDRSVVADSISKLINEIFNTANKAVEHMRVSGTNV